MEARLLPLLPRTPGAAVAVPFNAAAAHEGDSLFSSEPPQAAGDGNDKPLPSAEAARTAAREARRSMAGEKKRPLCGKLVFNSFRDDNLENRTPTEYWPVYRSNIGRIYSM